MPRKAATNTPESAQVPLDVIQKRAYEIWQGEGCPSDQDLIHWLQAEDEILKTLAKPEKPKRRRVRSTSTKSESIAAY